MLLSLRHFLRRREALAALVCGAFIAGASTARATSPKELCDGYEMALPRAVLRCSAADARSPAIAAQIDAATRAKQQCLELLEFSASQRHARIEPSAASACVAARVAYLRDPGRSRKLGEALRTACAEVIVGLRAAGETCDSAFDCCRGLVCRGATGTPPGTCAAPLPIGAACNPGELNGSDLFALIAAQRGVCGPGRHCAASVKGSTCAIDRGAGARCEALDGRACGVGQRCADGRCVDEARAGAGARCRADADCRVGDRCDGGRCAIGKAAGAACAGARECRGDCLKGRCEARCGSG